MPAYNSERGEIPLTVGGVEIVIAATMGGLATVSSRLNCQSFADLYTKLANVEINAVIVGIEALCVRGDVGAALKALSLADLPACKVAFTAAMMHHATKIDAGKAEAAKEETKAPRGGHGSNSPSETSVGAQTSSGAQP